MKLKTSCYDPALSRMQLRRFGPLFLLYGAALFLMTVTIMSRNVDARQACSFVMEYSSISAIINLGFAGLLALVFFGDIYNTRLWYGLRAMPITRGGWYGTQIFLCLFGSLIPNLLNAGLMLLYVKEFPIVVGWWLMASELQFLCFFGLAAVSAICAGNRIGMLILYIILNFTHIFLAWLVARLYEPLIYGLTNAHSEMIGSPIAVFGEQRIFNIDYTEIVTEVDGITHFTFAVERVYLSEWFPVMLAYGALGIAALCLGKYLLTKAKAETSGDLLAFPRLEPVILVLVTLGIGTAFHIASGILGLETSYLLLAAGLVVGYFGCLMLLKRQVNVFRKKAFLPLIGICAAVFLSLLLTGLDVMGIGDRIPETDKVASVRLDSSYSINTANEITDPEGIEQIAAIQAQLIKDGKEIISRAPLMERIFGNKQGFRYRSSMFYNGEDSYGDVYIHYELKDGSVLHRQYIVSPTSLAAPMMRQHFSKPEMALRRYSYNGEQTGIEAIRNSLKFADFGCYCNSSDPYYKNNPTRITDSDDLTSLFDAILADCETGNMAQLWFLHEDKSTDTIEFFYDVPYYNDRTVTENLYMSIYPSCENTFRWLIDHGYHEPISE